MSPRLGEGEAGNYEKRSKVVRITTQITRHMRRATLFSEAI